MGIVPPRRAGQDLTVIRDPGGVVRGAKGSPPVERRTEMAQKPDGARSGQQKKGGDGEGTREVPKPRVDLLSQLGFRLAVTYPPAVRQQDLYRA